MMILVVNQEFDVLHVLLPSFQAEQVVTFTIIVCHLFQENITWARVGPNSEYGPNTENRIIQFLKILQILKTELFVF